jgi:hypothetical protein
VRAANAGARDDTCRTHRLPLPRTHERPRGRRQRRPDCRRRAWPGGAHDDLAACIRDPQHTAHLDGVATFPGVATARPIHDGQLLLYAPDPAGRAKLMRYRFGFRGDAGDEYFFDGTKVLHTPGASIREQVTLYTRIHAGGPDGPVWGAGILVFRLRDLPAFLLSMRAVGASRLHGLRTFVGFAHRELVTPVAVA